MKRKQVKREITLGNRLRHQSDAVPGNDKPDRERGRDRAGHGNLAECSEEHHAGYFALGMDSTGNRIMTPVETWGEQAVGSTVTFPATVTDLTPYYFTLSDYRQYGKTVGTTTYPTVTLTNGSFSQTGIFVAGQDRNMLRYGDGANAQTTYQLAWAKDSNGVYTWSTKSYIDLYYNQNEMLILDGFVSEDDTGSGPPTDWSTVTIVKTVTPTVIWPPTDGERFVMIVSKNRSSDSTKYALGITPAGTKVLTPVTVNADNTVSFSSSDVQTESDLNQYLFSYSNGRLIGPSGSGWETPVSIGTSSSEGYQQTVAYNYNNNAYWLSYNGTGSNMTWEFRTNYSYSNMLDATYYCKPGASSGGGTVTPPISDDGYWPTENGRYVIVVQKPNDSRYYALGVTPRNSGF